MRLLPGAWPGRFVQQQDASFTSRRRGCDSLTGQPAHVAQAVEYLLGKEADRVQVSAWASPPSPSPQVARSPRRPRRMTLAAAEELPARGARDQASTRRPSSDGASLMRRTAWCDSTRRDLDRQPEKPAGVASKANGAREGMGCKSSAIRSRDVAQEQSAASGTQRPGVRVPPSRSLSFRRAAQQGEHFVRDEGVVGASPATAIIPR